MSTVQVLLSVYNGEPYLEPLLESLLRQDHRDLSILVRDDGSADRSVSILARFARDPRLRFYEGPHAGVTASFFDLLERADTHAQRFAFCDQDDIWLPDKVTRAIERLDAEPNDVPVLYCGRQIVVDRSLRHLGLSKPFRRPPSLSNALVENIAAGCTIVLNVRARAILLGRRPTCDVLHDAWAYLAVSAFGRVVFDDRPMVMYRQHGGNLVGYWRHPLTRLRQFRRNRHRLSRLALDFHRLFGADLSGEAKAVVERFLRHRDSWHSTVRYALRPDVYRQTPLHNLLLRVAIVLGHL